ncbi:MAG: lipopolysaccharide biosynthesis protein [Sphingobacterium sp.]|jgi:O-antigen/teichoic acid export membrane protein|nr:lipopolysaccharide biosynthesis protein [Sphingobacterium sp.]
MSLQEKAVNGVIWNTISRFSSYGLEFVIGIFLARILGPKDFGVIASITVIIALLEVFINSGYSQALIRERQFDQIAFSTVFWFNLLIGLLVYAIIYFSSNIISVFFNTGNIAYYIQALSLTLIINSISLIQRTILTRDINFKKQTFIAVISTIVAGICALVLAVRGYGVWSLVFKILVFRSVECVLLWTSTRWYPILKFSLNHLKTLTKFASKLLISGLIDVSLKNINYIVVSKFLSVTTLGFYTRAEMFKNLPSQNLTSIMTTVSYPALSVVQDDKEKLTKGFEKVFTLTYYISCLLMFTLLGVSSTLVLSMLGDKWEGSIPLLQLLCLVGLFNPINSLCGNLLNVVGKSNIYLNLQVVANILLIPSIFFGVLFGIEYLIIGNLVSCIFMYLLFGHYTAKFVDYTLNKQLIDVGKNLIFGIILCISLLLFGHFLNIPNVYILIIQFGFALLFFFISGEVMKIKEYMYIKNLILRKYGK